MRASRTMTEEATLATAPAVAAQPSELAAPIGSPGVGAGGSSDELIRERGSLFGLGVALLFGLFAYCAALGWTAYRDGELERQALRANLQGEDYARYLLFTSTMRPLELFATVRYLTVFLGFVLIVFGSLFILVYSPSLYKLRLTGGPAPKGTFETASPGLVLATLGSILVVLSLFRTASPHLELPLGSASPRPAATETPPGAPKHEAPELGDMIPGLDARPAAAPESATKGTATGAKGTP